MLYSLDVADPQEMARLLQVGLPVKNRIYEGSYLLQGSSLSVRVSVIIVLNDVICFPYPKYIVCMHAYVHTFIMNTSYIYCDIY